jgi:MFS family permease
LLDTRPLRLRAFRHLAAAATINEFGNWIGELALAIVVYDRTGSALATAALFLSLRFAPALLGPLLTAYAEAWPPRRLLPAFYLLEAVLFATLALLPRHTPLGGLLALCAVDGTLAIAAGAVTRGVAATVLVESDQLRQGNGLLNIGTMAASAVGPVVAGAIIAAWNPRAALALNAASFLLVAIIIVTADRLRVESGSEREALARLRAGLALIRQEPRLLQLLTGLSLTLLFGAIAVPIEVVFAKHTLHAGDTGYGFLLAAWGVGQIIGGIAFASAVRARIGYVLAAASALIAVGYGGLSISPSLAVQEAIPTTRQSAVMAVVGAVTTVATAFGFIAGGAITSITSPRVAYAVSGAGVLMVLGAALLLMRFASRTAKAADMATQEIGASLRIEDSENAAVMSEPLEDASTEPASAHEKIYPNCS